MRTVPRSQHAPTNLDLDHRWRYRTLAFSAGVFPALGFPAPSIGILGIVGLAPLVWLICSAPSCRESGWRVWLGGTGFFIAVHHWLIPSTGPFVVPLAMTLGVLWIPWGVIGWKLLGRDRSPLRLAAALVLMPSAWVVAEYFRAWDRLGGPWGLLGTTQWQNRMLLNTVSIGGVWLLSLLLFAINVAVASVFLPETNRRMRFLGLIAIAALIAVATASSLAVPDPHRGETFAVAGVQPGVNHDPAGRFDAHVDLTRNLIGSDLDLVVWAESSVGFDLQPGSVKLESLRELAAEVGAPILVNTDSRRGTGGIFKASVLIGSRGIIDRYDKMRLVPFGEYVPLRRLFGWVNALTDAADEDRRRGASLVVMDVDGVAIGPLVCFESAFPDLTRRLVDSGADLIVVQSATTTFQGSWAQPQHASLAAVRAVEISRPVVHAAVSGVSAVFAADGERLVWLDSREQGTWRIQLYLASGTTFYVRTGDWVPVGCGVLLVAALGVGYFTRARSRCGPTRNKSHRRRDRSERRSQQISTTLIQIE